MFFFDIKKKLLNLSSFKVSSPALVCDWLKVYKKGTILQKGSGIVDLHLIVGLRCKK